ncbi:chemotaxis protein CheC [Alishewanella tabrizica]|uniref:Chemotaxis protein CheC n=1 Tax=Alishewanella tabrizica TaxID=671278 RepID=A0ABQ2WL32_9ALTE|nr:chemotaxis protein CheC [Alishewanella tabrizica]GGW56889.1 chemotaxis protein CheC [Alishewanella tabrizica]
MNALLSEAQRDALQELMNISMGQAANALARLIETRITLSIPRIVAATPSEFAALLSQHEENWFTRQSFMGKVNGEALTQLTKEGCEALAVAMDYDVPLSDASRKELVLELANILAGACLTGFSEQLDLATKLSMPTLYVPTVNSGEQVVEYFRWTSTLLLEVEFSVDASLFDSKVIICLEQRSVQTLLASINELLE